MAWDFDEELSGGFAEQRLKLAVGSYSRFRVERGGQLYLPMQASLGAPAWWSESPWPPLLQELRPMLAPFGLFGIEDYAEFDARYLDRLDRYERRIRATVGELVETYPGAVVQGLCFENVARPGSWCHRTLFARWAVARGLAADVPELG